MKKKIEENRNKRLQEAEKLRQEQEQKEQENREKREAQRKEMFLDIQEKRKHNQGKDLQVEWIGRKSTQSRSTEHTDPREKSEEKEESSTQEETLPQNEDLKKKWNPIKKKQSQPKSGQNKKDIPVEIYFKEKKDLVNQVREENKEIEKFLQEDDEKQAPEYRDPQSPEADKIEERKANEQNNEFIRMINEMNQIVIS